MIDRAAHTPITDPPPPASTELVVLDPPAAANDRGEGETVRLTPVSRPDACFVTQLLANAAHAPQTRQLRRASPEDARSSYRATLDDVQAPANAALHMLSKVA